MKKKLILCCYFILFVIGIQQQTYAQCVTCPGNTVEGLKASALGDGNTALGNYSFIAGRNSTATQHYASVIGSWSGASGGHSFVIGSTSFAQGNFSYVFGNNSIAEHDFSLAIGHNLKARGGGFVIGRGKIDAILTNNYDKTLVVGFNSDKPTLFVGMTPSGYESGRIGIGNVTAPQAKLHIRGDAQEDATLRLEATGSQKQSRFYFSEEHQIRAAGNTAMHFHSSENKGFVFHDGDIYLHDIQSGIIMKSPNGQCWRGTLNDQGMLVFNPVACPDDGTTGSNTNNSPAQDIRIYPNPANNLVIIETGQIFPNAEVIIAGMDGRQHIRQRLNGNTTRVDIGNIAPGTYLIVVEQSGARLSSHRLLVN